MNKRCRTGGSAWRPTGVCQHQRQSFVEIERKDSVSRGDLSIPPWHHWRAVAEEPVVGPVNVADRSVDLETMSTPTRRPDCGAISDTARGGPAGRQTGAAKPVGGYHPVNVFRVCASRACGPQHLPDIRPPA